MTHSITTLRDQIAALIPTALPELASEHVVVGKRDVVETFPTAAIYLGGLSSRKAAMKGVRERTYEIVVAVFRKVSSISEDLETTFLNDVDKLEAAVEDARKSMLLNVQKIAFVGSSFNFPPDSKNKEGAVSLTFEVEMQQNL